MYYKILLQIVKVAGWRIVRIFATEHKARTGQPCQKPSLQMAEGVLISEVLVFASIFELGIHTRCDG
ncbi:MAG: hypothetical protein AMJ75_00935 [Phycisphaerae bacterium SM1_79]|nr:MAG: hypothetical protein AMJ75_00935 [Phycisphaerae bacterium SM1_79]